MGGLPGGELGSLCWDGGEVCFLVVDGLSVLGLTGWLGAPGLSGGLGELRISVRLGWAGPQEEDMLCCLLSALGGPCPCALAGGAFRTTWGLLSRLCLEASVDRGPCVGLAWLSSKVLLCPNVGLAWCQGIAFR